jgi:intracellular septation protein A
MKLLLDFLPIVLFFGMFKYAEGRPDWAAATASQWLGFMVAGSVVGSGVMDAVAESGMGEFTAGFPVVAG